MSQAKSSSYYGTVSLSTRDVTGGREFHMQQPLTLEQKTTDDVLRQAQLITCKSTSFHQLHRVELSHTLVSDRGMIDVKNVHFKCMI